MLKKWNNNDKITFGSGSEKDIEWSVKNIREHGTGMYYNCGVCEHKVWICDVEASGQDSITVATHSLQVMEETSDQHEPLPIYFWKKDIHNPISQSEARKENNEDVL
tara:strand:- start:674 stop:994 length:321 start_codon:yes stop_codon:yes gene_type:complete